MEYINGALGGTVIGLYILGFVIKDTPKIPSWLIPYILLVVSGVISPLILGGYNAENIVQAIIAAGLAVYGDQLIKQGKKPLERVNRMNQVEKFLSEIKAGCVSLWEAFGILPSVAAGQAAIESGWGQSGLSTKYNNLFGIKGSYEGNTVNLPTTEFYDGKTPVQIVDGFRSYPNWSTSILDYGLFLNENPRYKEVIGLNKYKDQITAIWSAGYATDPDYISKVVSTIEHNKLFEWDQEVLKVGGNTTMVTQAQGLQWANKSIGKKYDFDGAYGAQCFDLINQYACDLFKTSFSGAGAIDLLDTGNKNGFKVIVDGDGLYPQEGDIFIMWINSHRWGHTGIVLSADKVGMWVVDQNFDGSANQPAQKRYIKYVESYGVIKGWIRPPWSNGSNNSTESGKKEKSGKFTVTVEALNVRDQPNRKGSIVATYKKVNHLPMMVI